VLYRSPSLSPSSPASRCCSSRCSSRATAHTAPSLPRHPVPSAPTDHHGSHSALPPTPSSIQYPVPPLTVRHAVHWCRWSCVASTPFTPSG
jgi:hypothetical protein